MFILYQIDNTKKSHIKGLYLDNGKVYFDNVYIKAYRDKASLQGDIKKLFCHGEIAVLYTEKNLIDKDSIAFIEDKKGNTSVLYNRLLLRRDKLSIREIKSLLYQYKGMTIYKYKGFYAIEIYY